MSQATRLTQVGDLQAATAAIQRALRGDAAGGMPPPPFARARPADDSAWTIDMEPSPVRPAPQGEARSPSMRSDLPAAGRFIGGSFAGPTGSRDYKLYVPPAAGDRPLPLLVMLHGCTQNPDDFAA